MLDIGALLNPQRGHVPTTQAAGAVNGTGIDRIGQGDAGLFSESAVLLVMVGATAGGPTSFTVDVKIQDSADNTTFADISPAIAITQIVAASTSQAIKFRLKALRRYIRAVCTVAFVGGASPTVVTASAVILGGEQKVPQTFAP